MLARRLFLLRSGMMGEGLLLIVASEYRNISSCGRMISK